MNVWGGRCLHRFKFNEIIKFLYLSTQGFIFLFQVNENFAIDLIAEQPVSEVESRIVSCDGGGGALGHPKVYINLVM